MSPYYTPPTIPSIKQEYIRKIDFRMINKQSHQINQTGPINLHEKNLSNTNKKNSQDYYNSTVVHGFGNNVSLDFAVRQIVPKTMKIIYIGNINKNEKVSWIGERPWDQVIQELVFYRNIQIKINSSVVILIKHKT